MYTLNKWADELAPGVAITPAIHAQHSIIYVAKGSACINGVTTEADSAVHVEDCLQIRAGSEGATLWRWGLMPAAGRRTGLLTGDGVSSVLRMERRVKMFEMVPTSKWLFRLDCILEFEGTTGLHSHPGSGIRCLLSGHLRTESEKGENTENSNLGDVWYEEGSYPLVSTVDPGLKTTFLRGMILPPEYMKFGETATWIEGHKAKFAAWKPLMQKAWARGLSAATSAPSWPEVGTKSSSRLGERRRRPCARAGSVSTARWASGRFRFEPSSIQTKSLQQTSRSFA